VNRAPETTRSGRVLVVDDHTAARESIADVLRHAGYEVVGSASAVEALPLLEQDTFDVVVTDLQMPGMDGLEFIRQIGLRRLQVQILMVTAHATIASAVEAMRQGAFDYLEKPFDAAQLEELVGRARQRSQLFDRDETTTEGDARSANFATNRVEGGCELGMVGASEPMNQLRTRIVQVAPTDETVLICGESGTGKELVARAIHASSSRAEGPLISLNCPALSSQLTESELFGHRRGAFTGAEDDRVGRFEMARGGTIFLDEITEISLPLQAKLLRVLQERTFERVGCSETRTANVRVIASTNRNLAEEVAAGRFREDLYYRLAVVPLELPPLRDRDGDAELLADHFVARACERLNRPMCRLEPDAKELLALYRWPGNVRELENIVTRACVLNQGEPITAEQLSAWLDQTKPSDPSAGGSALPVGESLQEIERQMILATLEHYQGHRAQAAEALGIGVRTLSGKLRGYGYAPRTKNFGDPPTEGDQQILPLASAVSAETVSQRIA